MKIKDWGHFKEIFNHPTSVHHFQGKNIDFFDVYKTKLVDTETPYLVIGNDNNGAARDVWLGLESQSTDIHSGVIKSKNLDVFNWLHKIAIEHGSHTDKYESQGQECVEYDSPCGKFKIELSYDSPDLDDIDYTKSEREIEILVSKRAFNSSKKGHIEFFNSMSDNLIFQYQNQADSKKELEEKQKQIVSIPIEAVYPESIFGKTKAEYRWISDCGNAEMKLVFDIPSTAFDIESNVVQLHSDSLVNCGKMTFTDILNETIVFEYDNSIPDNRDQVVEIPMEFIQIKYSMDKKRHEMEKELKNKSSDGSLSR